MTKKLQSKLNKELNRCADCNCYGAEERYIHYRAGVKLCDDCDTKERAFFTLLRHSLINTT